jgi:hypothetical protein
MLEFTLIALPDLYHLDYLTTPLSRRSSQRSQRLTSPLSPRSPARRKSKKLNLALYEDPLVAMMSAQTPGPLTPPAEQENHFESLDAPGKLPHTPVTDQDMEDPFENCMTEAEAAHVEKPHLITHAKVYAIAEK